MEEALGVFRVVGDNVGLVGRLSIPSGAFAYEPSYLAGPQAAPISCSLPLRATPYDVADSRPYFEGLLPEGLERQAVAASLHVREDDWLSILWGYGFECVGDVIVSAHEEELSGWYEPFDMGGLARSLMNGAAAGINGVSRLSLAGTQGKIGLYHESLPSISSDADYKSDWFLPRGGAASTHILKSSRLQNALYLEYLCMTAARGCGLSAAEVCLLDLGGPVLCSKRYDRTMLAGTPNRKVVRRHQEDFAQALGLLSGSKYAELPGGTARTIAQFIRERFDYPLRDLEAFARLTLYNYLVGNCDNHLKNISVLYSADWFAMGLAPAYDIVCTTWFPDLSREMGMELGGDLAIDNVAPGHIREFARDIGLAPRRLEAMCLELVSRFDGDVLDAVKRAPDSLDEVGWKAQDLLDDVMPRKEVLAAVAEGRG